MFKLRSSVNERARSEVLLKVSQSSISLSKASELLGVSYRQVLRIWKRYQSAGAAGLKHGRRDRASNRRFDVGRRERVLELYRAKYGDFGPTLAVEYGPSHKFCNMTLTQVICLLFSSWLWNSVTKEGTRPLKFGSELLKPYAGVCQLAMLPTHMVLIGPHFFDGRPDTVKTV